MFFEVGRRKSGAYLDLVPALIEPHGHGADEGLDACAALVVGSAESPPHILVVQDLRHGDKGEKSRHATISIVCSAKGVANE